MMVMVMTEKQTVLLLYRVCSDALIASVLDGVRASGNRDVHVKMKFTHRGHRLGNHPSLDLAHHCCALQSAVSQLNRHLISGYLLTEG